MKSFSSLHSGCCQPFSAPRNCPQHLRSCARVQSCANHVQHIGRLSSATCRVPLGTRGEFSDYVRQRRNSIYFNFISLAETVNRWRRGGNRSARRASENAKNKAWKFKTPSPGLHEWHHNHSAKTCIKHPACRWLCSMVRWRTNHRIQNTINEVCSWTESWALQLNTTKTVSTLFTLSTATEKVSLKFNNQPVPQVETPTFLGVTLDTRLTRKPHLEAVEAKATRKLAVMKKLAGTTEGRVGRKRGQLRHP